MQDQRWPTYAPRNIVLEGAADDHPRGSLRVRAEDGRVFLDAIGGIGCCPIGHAHPAWRDAITQQLGAIAAVANTFWTRPQQQLARRLSELFGIANGQAFLCNSGTEATEAAIKLVVRATGRDTIVAFQRAFHGRTLGAIALTAKPEYRTPYVGTPEDSGDEPRFSQSRVRRLPFNDIEALREVFADEGERIAAVFLEPIQGEGGIFPATKSFLLEARELCSRHGALLGLDEIQSGSGRTGRWTAWQSIVGDDAAPDVIWLAKALGGGFPIGACLARPDLAQHMRPGTHGSTFGGNPLACAAALATLRIIEEEGLLDAAAAQWPTLQRLAAERPIAGVTELRGCGAMLGIQIGPPEEQRAKAVGAALSDAGVLTTVCGGHTLRLLFPYRAGAEELSTVWEAIRGALAS
ncbi:MAG: aspartate aminotransferase family protein [Myxococcales bacterium FL481]|nr:MAG: aspartate aminotransferase family protein [Myxococcales bacterium FL481]